MFFKLGPVGNATQNPNFCISLLIFGPNFGIQEKVTVCFLLELLLLILFLVPRVFFSKLLIIFCNAFLSCPFLQNISTRYFISTLKYFSEQILVALARNSLNMLVIVSVGIQECGLICTFVRAGIAYTFLEPDLRLILLQWFCVPNSECNLQIKQP